MSDPAGLGAGTMTVKTTFHGVLQYENWTYSGGPRLGEVSNEKVRVDKPPSKRVQKSTPQKNPHPSKIVGK